MDHGDNVIYLVSDDSYFSLGVTEYLKTQQLFVTPILPAFCGRTCFTIKDTILISLEERNQIITVLNIISRHPCRIIFFIDSRYDFPATNLQPLIVCEKTISLHKLKSLCTNSHREKNARLTHDQKYILTELFSGKSTESMARENRYSRRDVSTNKNGVFRLLGIRSFTSQIIALLNFVIAKAS